MDNLGPMPKRDVEQETKLELQWKGRIARHIRHLRRSFMEAQSAKTGTRMSLEKFSELARLPWKTIDNIENGRTWPGIHTLNRIVTACETDLGEFFGAMVTRDELESIQLHSKEEREWIDALISGLSHPKTRRFVAEAARTVTEWLQTLEKE